MSIAIINMLNYDYTSQRTQPIWGESETVPDQSLSMREIMDRFAKGLPLGGQQTEIWDGDDEDNFMPDPKTLDLSELEDIKSEYQELSAKNKKREDEKAYKAEQKKLRDSVRSELESELRAGQPNPNPPQPSGEPS